MSTVRENLSEELIDIGGYRLCLQCAGEGKPTVVIDAGSGEGRKEYQWLQSQVAAFTRVCTFDRAGLGRSDKGPKPRTSQQMVNELHALLSNARVDPPYVLVGHSISGLNARLYAAEYPHEVVGIVLLDPTPPDILPRLDSVWGEARTKILWTLQVAMAGEGRSKQNFATDFEQVTAAKLPDVPLVVISAGQPLPLPGFLNSLLPSATLNGVMQAGGAALAKASGKGEHLIAEKSNHITLRQDDFVVAAIQRVVQTAR